MARALVAVELLEVMLVGQRAQAQQAVHLQEELAPLVMAVPARQELPVVLLETLVQLAQRVARARPELSPQHSNRYPLRLSARPKRPSRQLACRAISWKVRAHGWIRAW